MYSGVEQDEESPKIKRKDNTLKGWTENFKTLEVLIGDSYRKQLLVFDFDSGHYDSTLNALTLDTSTLTSHRLIEDTHQNNGNDMPSSSIVFALDNITNCTSYG
eukprot:Gb_29314 [translate_table: standard]